MHKAMFAVPVLVVLCLACSSGRRRAPKSNPPPSGQASSMEEVLLRLGSKKCRLRETTAGLWVLDFLKRGIPPRTFVVERVGTDYVRVSEGEIGLNIPFRSISVVMADQ